MSARRERAGAGWFASVVLALLALTVVREATAATVDPLTLDEKRQFNYAFATELGSGIYDVSGRTVQIYSLPLSYTFKKTKDAMDDDSLSTQRGWRFTYPLTLGFFSLNAEDIIDNGLSQNVATVSLVPGVEFLVPAASNWLLRPYIEAGHVWDRAGDADAGVYSTGLRSRADFVARRFNLTLGDGLTFTVVDPKATPGQESLVTLETAFQARHLFSSSGGNKADYGLYFVQHLYFSDTDHPFAAASNSSVVDQYEVGVTFGSRDPMKIWKIGLPRIGVGYLFGHELSVIRIVFGTPAPSLER